MAASSPWVARRWLDRVANKFNSQLGKTGRKSVLFETFLETFVWVGSRWGIPAFKRPFGLGDAVNCAYLRKFLLLRPNVAPELANVVGSHHDLDRLPSPLPWVDQHVQRYGLGISSQRKCELQLGCAKRY